MREMWFIFKSLQRAHGANPVNPTDNLVASSQRFGLLANIPDIGGGVQSSDILQQNRQRC